MVKSANIKISDEALEWGRLSVEAMRRQLYPTLEEKAEFMRNLYPTGYIISRDGTVRKEG